MNSKFYLLLFAFVCSGCGVKSRPLSPPETAIPSYIESYTGPGDPATTDKEKKPETPLEQTK